MSYEYTPPNVFSSFLCSLIFFSVEYGWDGWMILVLSIAVAWDVY